jgi:hypothetical protein
MSRTYTVENSPATASSAPASMVLAAHTAAANDRLPDAVIPESQFYYWTRAWQENERRAAAELDRGEGVAFDDLGEAARWLLSSED